MSKEITFESLKLSYEAKKFLDVVHGCKILLEKEPIFFDCEFLLASSLVESGQNLESIKVFEAILKKYKEFPSTIYYNLSSAYKNQHMFKDALFYARQFVNLNPDNLTGYLRLGECYTQLSLRGEQRMSFLMALSLDPGNQVALKGLSESHRTSMDSAGALKYLLQQTKTPRRDMNILEAYYYLGNKLLFNNKLLELNKEDVLLPLVACLSTHASIRYSQRDNYKFCPDPFNYIQHLSLGKEELNKEFVEEVISVVNKYNFSYKPQSLLINGTQTLGPGNIFNLEDDCIVKLKSLIENKITDYRNLYNTEGLEFFQSWPSKEKSKLTGWIINLNTGGSLKKHIHKEGWLSGSLYLNIPDKKNINEGDIVFSLNGDTYPTDGKFYPEKTVGLSTGDMVLFPSSIFHSTIPFSSQENRVTLAFDIIPKYMND